MGHLFAFLDAGDVAVFIPIVALFIPIVAILVKHQQKMASIIHGGGGVQTANEIAALREEVRQLQTLIHSQAIALDELRTLALNVPPQAPRTTEQKVGF